MISSTIGQQSNKIKIKMNSSDEESPSQYRHYGNQQKLDFRLLSEAAFRSFESGDEDSCDEVDTEQEEEEEQQHEQQRRQRSPLGDGPPTKRPHYLFAGVRNSSPRGQGPFSRKKN